MATKTHSIQIIINARNEASEEFDQVGKSASSMVRIIKTAAAAAAGFVSIRAIVGALKNTATLYGSQEVAVKSLSGALSMLNEDVRGNIDDMQDFASWIQEVTVHSAQAILEVMTLGAAVGKLGDKDLKTATISAIGLAKAFKINLASAMKLITRARHGDTASLKQYGIVLDKNLSAQTKFNHVLALGARNFRLATEEVETYEGAKAQLVNSITDVKKIIGQALVPVLKESAIEHKNWAENNKEAIGDWAATTVANIKWAALAFKFTFVDNLKLSMNIAGTFYALKLVEMGADTKHWLTVVIPETLLWFKDNWRDVFQTIWDGTKAIFVNMFNNIVDFFKAIRARARGEDLNFEWTPLLDGFESSLKKLPEIAEREIGPLEKKIKEQLANMNLEFSEKWALAFAPLDPSKSKAGKSSAADVANMISSTLSKAIKDSRLPAREGRFLTRAPGHKDPGLEIAKNTALTAANTAILAAMTQTKPGPGVVGGKIDSSGPATVKSPPATVKSPRAIAITAKKRLDEEIRSKIAQANKRFRAGKLTRTQHTAIIDNLKKQRADEIAKIKKGLVASRRPVPGRDSAGPAKTGLLEMLRKKAIEAATAIFGKADITAGTAPSTLKILKKTRIKPHPAMLQGIADRRLRKAEFENLMKKTHRTTPEDFRRTREHLKKEAQIGTFEHETLRLQKKIADGIARMNGLLKQPPGDPGRLRHIFFQDALRLTLN